MYDTTPKTRRRYCPTAIAAATAAAGTMIGADLAGADNIYRFALTCFLIAATTLITLRTGVNTEVIEHARQAGYDAGYEDGESVRPSPPTALRRIV